MAPIKEDVKRAVKTVEKKLYLDNKKKGILDAIQEKMVSRKLLVFLTATGLLWAAELDPQTWGLIAIVYIGGQSVIDTMKVWRHGGQS